MIGFLKKFKVIFMCLLFILGLSVESCYAVTLPENFAQIQKEKDKKISDLKSLGVNFYNYNFNCPTDELKKRFDEMTEYRWKIYFKNPQDIHKPGAIGVFNEEYKPIENWDKLKSRFAYPTGLAYNVAHKNYNAGILIADAENIFLAIEAPSSKNIDNFYEMISEYDVESLVRLNSFSEYDEDFYPYWEKYKLEESSEKLKIGDNIMDYYEYNWAHKQDANVKDIAEIVENVLSLRKGKIMAVSCRAGAGRTGTYICSYLILNEIKKQIDRGVSIDDISLNIDKIVWEMSVQRPFAVTHFPQYEMLYRLADYKLTKLKETTLE